MRRTLALIATPVLLLAACSSSTSSTQSTASATASAPAPAASAASTAKGMPTAAACDEINRMTHEDMKGLTGASANDWSTFAVNLQSIANSAADPAFRTALTDVATAALTASESLASGAPGGKVVNGFVDAIPNVDHLCKQAGIPLN